jgi:LCP family protein required for cell wall assembly
MKNKIDLNKEFSFKFEDEDKKIKPKSIAKAAGYITVFIFVAFVVFSNRVLISGQGSTSWITKLPIISTVKHLVKSADKKLKGEDRGRINILLLGMGGKNHEGGLLTDTIILVSLDTQEKKAALLSIPRDLSVPIEGRGWRKINNINAYAELQEPGSGGLAVSQAIGDILEIPIDYYVRLDFKGFVNIIDELGGIKVYVENTLDDKRYPIMGMEDAEPYEARFEHLHIEKGWQKMDGELALKYVRSRHAAGVEGSDFARSRRQQKVLEAVKEKLLSKYVLFKPRMISSIINEIDEHVSTNLKIWEMVKLWNMFKDMESNDIINKGLNNSPNGLLVDMITEEGAYILVPRSGDFAEIQYMVHNIFSDAPVEAKERVITEATSVEVLNGTWVNGLASRVALDLEKFGFNIVHIGNYNRQNFEKSTIYDLTYGEKINSLTVLKEKTGADINFGLPEWLINDLAEQLSREENIEQPDFILIIGQDMDSTASGVINTE